MVINDLFFRLLRLSLHGLINLVLRIVKGTTGRPSSNSSADLLVIGLPDYRLMTNIIPFITLIGEYRFIGI